MESHHHERLQRAQDCCYPIRQIWWPARVTLPVPRIKSPLHHFNASEPWTDLQLRFTIHPRQQARGSSIGNRKSPIENKRIHPEACCSRLDRIGETDTSSTTLGGESCAHDHRQNGGPAQAVGVLDNAPRLGTHLVRFRL
jgi:hypothetical protein